MWVLQYFIQIETNTNPNREQGLGPPHSLMMGFYGQALMNDTIEDDLISSSKRGQDLSLDGCLEWAWSCSCCLLATHLGRLLPIPCLSCLQEE